MSAGSTAGSILASILDRDYDDGVFVDEREKLPAMPDDAGDAFDACFAEFALRPKNDPFRAEFHICGRCYEVIPMHLFQVFAAIYLHGMTDESAMRISRASRAQLDEWKEKIRAKVGARCIATGLVKQIGGSL